MVDKLDQMSFPFLDGCGHLFVTKSTNNFFRGNQIIFAHTSNCVNTTQVSPVKGQRYRVLIFSLSFIGTGLELIQRPFTLNAPPLPDSIFSASF